MMRSCYIFTHMHACMHMHMYTCTHARIIALHMHMVTCTHARVTALHMHMVTYRPARGIGSGVKFQAGGECTKCAMWFVVCICACMCATVFSVVCVLHACVRAGAQKQAEIAFEPVAQLLHIMICAILSVRTRTRRIAAGK